MFENLRKTMANGCIKQRYILTIMGFLAIANAYTMRVCLSVAITAMVFHGKENNTRAAAVCLSEGNITDSNEHSIADFDWNEEVQGLILSSFFWGYIITHLPGGILAERFGGKYSLGLGILCTAIFTLLTPLAAQKGGVGWLIAVRVIAGLGEGPTFPALNALLANWVPPNERGVLGSFVFAGSLIGTVAGNAVSGVLIEATGSWASVFYLFGGIGVLWYILWHLLCYNGPESHPFISDEEKQYLNDSISGLSKREDVPPVPWMDLVKSLPLWGLLFAQVGHDWGFYTMVTDLPKYMKDVLGFSTSMNGFLSSVPYVAMWIISVSSGWLADWIIVRGYISTTNVRKIFTTIASLGPAAGIIAASYAGCDKVAVVALFTLAMALMGTFYPGMKVNGLDLSPNYAGTLMAITNGTGSLAGIIAPYLIGVLTPNSGILEWRIVFWITLVIFAITNLVFVLTASGEVQYWNNTSNSKPRQRNGIPHEGISLQDGNLQNTKPHD